MGTFGAAVIGLGVMGASALRALAARGVSAVGIEQFTPGHARGSSHGESRIFRLAYFEHPAYVPLALAARDAWRRLERETGTSLFTATGILEAGPPGSAIVAGSQRAAAAHGLAQETLDAAEAARRFPAFRLPAGWQAVFQPDAGFLRAEAAVEAMLLAAGRNGAAILSGRRVSAIEPGRDGVRIVIDEAEALAAERVVVCAGPWLGRLVPGLAGALTVTRQTVGWFAPANPALVAPDAMPVFILDASDDTVYGFPDFCGSGVKAASHRPGATVRDPDDAATGDAEAEVSALRDWLAPYLPAAAGAVRRSSRCLYTRTADEHFAIGLHPQDRRIVLASACSGHGFKFASILGEVLAELALDGATRHDIALFALGRCWNEAKT